MADTSSQGPLVSRQSKLAAVALAYLFLYSVAMFTLPFVAFFGVRHMLTEYYPVEQFAKTVWSVIAAVIAVNIIICAYAYKAYYEKEYDDDGNEIDQHSYTISPTESDKNQLNLKED